MRITRAVAVALNLDYDALMERARSEGRAAPASAVPGEPRLAGVTAGDGRWELAIDSWRPVSLNRLMRGKGACIRLKKRERSIVVAAFDASGVPRATGKRRVSLRIRLARGMRRYDDDNNFKALGDALKHAGTIVNDSPDWIAWGPIEYERGDSLATTIILEDL